MSDSNEKLDRTFIEQQRQRLDALRSSLLGADEARLEEEQAFQESRGEEAREGEDEGQHLAYLDVQLGLHDAAQRRLAAVDRALQKIAEGSYGLSDISGDPIRRSRLEVMPEATLTAEEEAAAERGQE